MKKYLLLVPALFVFQDAFAASGDTGVSSAKPGVTTTNRANPDAPISPGIVNNGEPNSGALPMPGQGAAGSPGSEAVSPGTNKNLSNNRPQGPGNPATELQRSSALELEFPAGNSALTDDMKKRIDQLIDESHRRGQIASVRVMGWGDVGYPGKKAKVTDEQKALAEMRAESIEKYIREAQNPMKIEKFNMAERPSALASLLKTSDAKNKHALETMGLAGNGANKASKAIVMVIVR